MSSRRLNLSVQYVCNKTGLPLRPQIRCWARAAVQGGGQVTIRFVDSPEGRLLNRDYRGKDYATNVLSFAYASAPNLCGDLVLCAPVVEREAGEQGKSAEAHYAHLIVHGLLHLQGHDHESSRKEARQMENHERAILASLGYADPYAGEKQGRPAAGNARHHLIKRKIAFDAAYSEKPGEDKGLPDWQ